MDYAPILGKEPDEVVRPTAVEEVAAVLARAHETGRAVIPWGGGTGQTYGHFPRRADIVLDLSGLNRIVSHEPGDMTVTVQAGATLAAVQKKLGAHDQFLPLDPPRPDRATIGGILAVNAFGPSRLSAGTARDWLIGLTIVDAHGRIVKGGGKVVKNVTGYDLPKLHIGALGTLGVLVEATFKVAPVPEFGAAVAYSLGSLKTCEAFLAELHARLAPTLTILVDETSAIPGQEPGRRLIVAFDGMQEVVRHARSEAARLAEAHHIGGATTISPEARPLVLHSASGSSRLRMRLSGRPSAAAAQHEAVAAMGVWEWIRTLPGTGHTEAALRMGEDPDATAERVHRWASERKIAVTLLQASGALRETADIWSPLPPGFALMRRMKETLDPGGILNPGRFVGRL